jgi:hypothetical protein
MKVFSPLPDELKPAPDTSNLGSIIGKLSLKPLVNVIGVLIFLKEKPNDRSLLVLHPAMKNINMQECQHFSNRCSLQARSRMPNFSAWNVHNVGLLVMHEALLANR